MYEWNMTGESFETYGVARIRAAMGRTDAAFALVGQYVWDWLWPMWLNTDPSTYVVQLGTRPLIYGPDTGRLEIHFYHPDGGLVGRLSNIDTQ